MTLLFAVIISGNIARFGSLTIAQSLHLLAFLVHLLPTIHLLLLLPAEAVLAIYYPRSTEEDINV